MVVHARRVAATLFIVPPERPLHARGVRVRRILESRESRRFRALPPRVPRLVLKLLLLGGHARAPVRRARALLLQAPPLRLGGARRFPRVFRGEDEPDADSPLGDGDGERTPGTPSSEAFDRSGYASGASTPRADESFRSADALDLSLSRQSSVATPTRFADDADARRTPRTASARRYSARETFAPLSSSESDDGSARPSPTASLTASESRRRWTRAATDIDDDGTDEDASPDPRRLTRSPATRRR